MKITITDVKLNNLTLELDMFTEANNHKLYFVPTAVVDLLLKKINVNQELNNTKYISNVLDIVKVIVAANQEQLHSSELKKICEDYNQILNDYSRCFIDRRVKYSVNEKKCFRYILRPLIDAWSFIKIEENESVNTYSFNLDEQHPLNNDNYFYTLMNAKIDAKLAIEANYQLFITKDKTHPVLKHKKIEMSQFVSRVNNILIFIQSRWCKTGRTVKRVYSSFSSLDSISRKYVSINGKPFYELDLKSAQPMLLAVKCINSNFTIEPEYIQRILNGTFYQHFQQYAETNGIVFEETFDLINPTEKQKQYFNDYDDVKQLLLRSVYFGNKNVDKSVTAKLFNELYPAVSNFCNLQKSNNISLACELQNQEADLILNVIPNCNYFTVHDAIYVTELSEIETIKNKINQTISYLTSSMIEEIRYNEKYNKGPEFEINIADNSNSSVLHITKKTKSHADSDINFNTFADLFFKVDKKVILETMKISNSTYARYKKRLKNN